MGDLYRGARRGSIDSLDASRMAGMLGGLRLAIESENDDELRERVKALEDAK